MKRLNKISFLLSIILFMSYQSDVYAQSKRVIYKNLSAIKRTDNSFVTYNDSTSIRAKVPLMVQKKINSFIARRSLSKTHDLIRERPLIFEVHYDNSTSIYVVKYTFMFTIFYQFIGLDLKSSAITETPPAIIGTYLENNEEGFEAGGHLISGKMIKFKDINNDGRVEVLTQERVHNGTAYNATITHIYLFDEKMRFNTYLCIESKMIYEPNNCVITRVLKNDTLVCNITCNNKTSIIGTVKLDLKRKKIIAKNVFQAEYKDYLITGGAVKENDFLLKGDNFIMN
jgi:hypothetical protein